MATIDDRVVAMSFENSKFERGVQSTLTGIDKLKNALNFHNAGKGLEQISTTANKTDFSRLSGAIDGLSGKFSALRVTGIAVMANLATKAVSTAAQFAKQFTVSPITTGLHEYELQINAVQTILGNTAAAGTKLKDVNAALNQLNTYADKTIYNFGQMTKNVGTFTAAGVDLKTSVASIKGIANLAALSGSNAEQASTAMYQLSQAISSGKVALQDWKSVENASMGSSTFKRALAQTAVHMGKLKDSAVALQGPMKNVKINGMSFRDSIASKPGKTSWLTSDVLTTTLKHLSGDLTDAQLKAEGYSKAQIKSIQATAKLALNSATQVKTLSQLMDTTKEALGSGWAQTWQIVFGDFGEAKKLFTSLSVAIGAFVGHSADARNKVLKDWKKLGGRTLLIDSIKNAFHALIAIIKPIKDAFRDIFPKKTGKDLFDLTKRLHAFTETLKPGPQTVENLRRTFRGFFAILDIGKQIVGGIFSVIGKLFGSLGDGSGGFLNLTGNIGDFLVSVDEALKKGDKLHNFFDTLGNIIAIPIVILHKLISAIKEAFSGSGIDNAGKSLGPLQSVIDGVTRAWDKFLGSVGSTKQIVKPALDGISHMFGAFGQAVADAIKGASFDSVFKVIEVGLIGGIFLTLKKALSGGLGNALAGGVLKSIVQAFTGVGGLTNSIGGTFNALTGSIKTMQQNVKSDTLKNIAISIALLSASMVGLSLVDPKRLNGALTAITIGFAQLLGAMAIMDKIGKSGGFIKMPVIAASMVVLATAIGILSISVAALSKLSWKELAKGLGAVSVLLVGLSASSTVLSVNAAGMIRAGTGITIIAVAMNILARAVKSFGGMNLPELAKGIGSVGVALAAIGAASQLFPSGMITLGLGLIAVAVGLKLLVDTIKKLGAIDIRTLAKGIGAIGLALAAIGLAMQTMPISLPITAAGLILVAFALKSITKTIGALGGMSIKELGKGIGALAAALLVLGVALTAMSGTLGGAAALAIAATGIALLAPALKMLGNQSWGQIIKGVVALAAALGVLGVAGLVLSPVVPAILALGVALIAVGAGLALAGAGVALIGIGLAAIAVAGPAAAKLLVDSLIKISLSLPKVVDGIVKALVNFVVKIGEAAPKFAKAIGQLLKAMAQAIVVAAPNLEKAFVAILELIFNVLRKEFPNLVKTGIGMLIALLKGIKDNIGLVVTQVAQIIITFLGAVAKKIPQIITAGVSILVNLLKGIGSNLAQIVLAVGSIFTKFLGAIGTNLGRVVVAGLSILTKLLSGISNNLSRVITLGGTIIARLVTGIGNAASKIATAALATATHFITSVAREIPKRVDQVATAVIKMLNDLAAVIRKREPEFIGAIINIGQAIVQGLISGIVKKAKELPGVIKKHIIDVIPGPIKKLLGVKSPSRVMKDIGENVIAGLVQGMSDHTRVAAASTALGNSVIQGFSSAVKQTKLMTNLGQQISQGFYKGLIGNRDDISKAFTDLQNKITDEIVSAKQKIATEQAHLDKLEKVHGKARNQDEIDKTTAAIRAQTIELHLLENGHDAVAKSIKKHKVELIVLSKQYDDITTKLDDARKALEEAKKIRDDFATSTSGKFGALPDLVTTDKDGNPVDPAEQLRLYKDRIFAQANSVASFKTTLDQLRALGLDNKTYQKLIDDGVADEAFAKQLLAGGKGAVDELNALDFTLDTVSQSLGTTTAGNLYDAGVAAAQGLVSGLKSQQDKIRSTMEEIASAMIKAIRKKLGIKSPSQIFAEVGKYSMEGMASGFINSSKVVTDAVYGVSEDAVKAMKESLNSVSNMITDGIDANPTITPILDLSKIQKGANQMSSMLNVAPVTATAGLGQISVISPAEQAIDGSNQQPIKFEQNNYSPESLSDAEIYRKTKNQLSQAREVLAK